MLRNTLFYLVLIVVSLLYFVPLHGQEEERGLPPFKAVSASGGVEVILESGDSERARIKTWGIDLDKVDVFVKGKTLKIQLLNISKIDERDVKVYVTYKELHGVRATAGARVYGRELIQSENFVVRVGSGGFADLEVETNSLEARAGEGGVIEISGMADTVDVSASTGGRYEGYDLEANRTHAKASTGGEITVVAHEALDASANTGGSIHYRGQPKEKSTRTLFSGGIHKM
jgi:hypothetical protein